VKDRKKTKMAEKWSNNGPKMTQKKPKESRDEPPISIDHTAHVARNMVEK